jgi:hypothetical protein
MGMFDTPIEWQAETGSGLSASGDPAFRQRRNPSGKAQRALFVFPPFATTRSAGFHMDYGMGYPLPVTRPPISGMIGARASNLIRMVKDDIYHYRLSSETLEHCISGDPLSLTAIMDPIGRCIKHDFWISKVGIFFTHFFCKSHTGGDSGILGYCNAIDRVTGWRGRFSLYFQQEICIRPPIGYPGAKVFISFCRSSL